MKKRGSTTGLTGSPEHERAEKNDAEIHSEKPRNEETKDAVEAAGGGEADTAVSYDETDILGEAALKLGLAMLKRLNVSADTDASRLVGNILAYWEKEPSAREIREKTAERREAHGAQKQNAPLPRPIRANVAETPEADYENMSSEQFNSLKRQFRRAALDGRRIKI